VKRDEKIKQWASNLTAEQMRPALEELVDFAIDAEMVSFPREFPYWSNTGEPLIAGQNPFPDDGDDDE
jgi:hypothetical protein